MHFKITILLLFLSVFSFAQTTLYGTFTITSVTGTAPNYTLTGEFNDQTGYWGGDSAQVGDRLFFMIGATCGELRIDTINATSQYYLDVDVTDIDTLFDAPPYGIGILSGRTSNYGFKNSSLNASPDLVNCVESRFKNEVDAINITLPDSLAYGTGTTNYLSRWIAPFTLGTAGISDDGSEIQFARPTVLYGVNTAAPATYGTFGIDNTLGIERPTFYNGSAWIPWLAYSGGTNQYSYFSNSNTITSGTQLFRSATGVEIGDGNYFKLPSNSTVGSQLGSTAGRMEFNSTAQNLSFRTSTATEYPVKSSTSTGLFTAGSVLFADANGRVAQDNSNLYWDDSANRLGIGTTTPTQQLQIAGNGAQTIAISSFISQLTQRSRVLFEKSRGTALSPSAIVNGDELGMFFWGGRSQAGSMQYPGGLYVVVNGTVSGTNIPADFRIQTGQNSSSRVDRVSITSGGLMGIGTISPDQLLHIELASSPAVLNYPFRITNTGVSTLTGNVGFGVGFEYEAETSTDGTNKVIAASEAVFTDATAGSEDADLIWKTVAGGTLAEYMRLNNMQLRAGNYRFNVDQDTTGTGGYVLTRNAATNEIELQAPPAGYSGFTPAAETGTGSNVASGGTATFTGGFGVNTSVTGTTVTIEADTSELATQYDLTQAQDGNGIFSVQDSAILDSSNKVYRDSTNGAFSIGSFPDFPNLAISESGNPSSGLYLSKDYWGGNILLSQNNTFNYSILEQYNNTNNLATQTGTSLANTFTASVITNDKKSRIEGVAINSSDATFSQAYATVASGGKVDNIGTSGLINNPKYASFSYMSADYSNAPGTQLTQYLVGIGKGDSVAYNAIGIGSLGAFASTQNNFAVQRQQGGRMYEYLSVGLEDTTQNYVRLYNRKYTLPNATPSSTSGDTTIMAWRGNGTTAEPIGFIPLPAQSPINHIITRTIYDGDAALPDSTVTVNGTFNVGFWRVPESMDGYTLTKASFGIFDKGDLATSGATYSFGVQKCNGSNMSCSNSSNVNFTPSSETELELSLSITLNANDILRVNYQPPQSCAGGCGTENVNGLVVTYTIQQN